MQDDEHRRYLLRVSGLASSITGEPVLQQERMFVALICMRRKKIKGYENIDICKYILDFI